MEQLTDKAKKYKRILVYFLKKQGVYKDFVLNTRDYYGVWNGKGNFYPKRHYFENIFNVAACIEGIESLLDDGKFFRKASAQHPQRITSSYDRYAFWYNIQNEWRLFCFYHKYEEITTIY